MAYEITDTSAYPWGTIVYVSVSYVDAHTGQPARVFDAETGRFTSGARASGVIVGTNDVLTAGHVVGVPWWLDLTRYAISIQVSPGADTSPYNAPYGSYTAASWSSYGPAIVSDVISASQSQYDVALLSFAEPIGEKLGWMQIDAANRNSGTANQTGYPGNGTGMMNALVEYTKNPYYYVYNTTEQLAPGASGGPLWYSSAQGAFVLGVLSSGGPRTDNYASLSAPGVFDWLTQQMAENDALMPQRTGNAITLSAPAAIATTLGAVGVSANTTGLDDVIATASENLPAAVIDGGPGTDVLRVTGGGLVDLRNISSVEILDLSGTVAANTVVNMGTDFTTVYLGPRGDTITISAPSATVSGGPGNDMFIAQAGAAAIDGAGGIDTVVYPLGRADYGVVNVSGVLKVSSTAGIDTLVGVERLRFADTGLAFDLDGNAGNAARIIGAAFGAERLEPALVGTGIAALDRGGSMREVAEMALNSALFIELAGSRADAAVVRTLYANAVGHPPPEEEFQHFLGLLQEGATQADLLVIAARSEANAQGIDLVGLATAGLEYV